MKYYKTYEEPLQGRVFNEKQMKEVYKDLANKNEYTTFEDWLHDMLKSGVFEEISFNNFIDDKEKMFDFIILKKDEFLKSYSYLTEEEYENTLQLVKQKVLERINWDK